MGLTVKGDPKTASKPRRVLKASDAPPKVGRLASMDERQRAQDLLDTFDIENDVDDLLRALRRFAMTGTFADTEDHRPAYARAIVRHMKDATFDERVQAVVDEMRVSESTAARLLRRR